MNDTANSFRIKRKVPIKELIVKPATAQTTAVVKKGARSEPVRRGYRRGDSVCSRFPQRPRFVGSWVSRQPAECTISMANQIVMIRLSALRVRQQNVKGTLRWGFCWHAAKEKLHGGALPFCAVDNCSPAIAVADALNQ